MIQRSGVCDVCGRADRLTQDGMLFRHRARSADGSHFSYSRAECTGTGSVPVFVWNGPGTGYATVQEDVVCQ